MTTNDRITYIKRDRIIKTYYILAIRIIKLDELMTKILLSLDKAERKRRNISFVTKPLFIIKIIVDQ